MSIGTAQGALCADIDILKLRRSTSSICKQKIPDSQKFTPENQSNPHFRNPQWQHAITHKVCGDYTIRGNLASLLFERYLTGFSPIGNLRRNADAVSLKILEILI